MTQGTTFHVLFIAAAIMISSCNNPNSNGPGTTDAGTGTMDNPSNGNQAGGSTTTGGTQGANGSQGTAAGTQNTSTNQGTGNNMAGGANGNNSNTGSKMGTANGKNEDYNFVVRAAATNNAELKVLQSAMDKGTDKELKSHVKMMLADHKQLGAKVKAYSAKKGYTLPDGDNGASDGEMNKLNGKKGKDYDKELTEHLVSAHKDAINLFETEQTKVSDPELKTMIGSSLATLHNHLNMMSRMQDKMGK
jgi:putative membrane protein